MHRGGHLRFSIAARAGVGHDERSGNAVRGGHDVSRLGGNPVEQVEGERGIARYRRSAVLVACGGRNVSLEIGAKEFPRWLRTFVVAARPEERAAGERRNNNTDKTP